MRLLRQTALRTAVLLSATFALLTLIGALSAGAPSAVAYGVDGAQWVVFRDTYLTPEGRIVDPANDGVSHSEGQGYGMLLAAAYNDREAFERMRRWTEDNLTRRDDHLHAWRYLPQADDHVPDTNNATDGDIFIAWALLRAGAAWNRPSYTKLGEAIARDVLRLCVVDYHGTMILVPGVKGFEQSDGQVLNLSYYAFPALRELARAVPSPDWSRLETDGLRLLRDARFGPWELPPDWLVMTPLHDLRPAHAWPARFSWDAIRIPLNLAWVGLRDEPALKSAVAFWTSPQTRHLLPAWASVNDGLTSIEPAGAGVIAIRDFAQAQMSATPTPILPGIGDTHGYFDAALVLLTRLAATEAPKAPLVAKLAERDTSPANGPDRSSGARRSVAN